MTDQETCWITTFAVKQQDNTYANILTCVRNTVNFPLYNWKKLSHKRNVHKFEACFSKEDGETILNQLTTDQKFTLEIEEEAFTFTFGELLRRKPVFIPYATFNSLANGWWPGTLKHGFWLDEWYPVDSIVQIDNKIFEWIQKQIGINLEKLRDFTSSVIRINALEANNPSIHFNPDYQVVAFAIHGTKTTADHRVILQLWEGKEAVHHEMIDLPTGTMNATFAAPFKPTKLGYELYRQSNSGNWTLTAAENHILIQQIMMNMGIVTGKVKILKNKQFTERDIVSYEKPFNTPKIDSPWVEAETQRIRINKAVELNELGSIFVRYNGNDTKKQIQQILQNNLYEDEHEKIYIWDPYVNDEVVESLLEYAITYPRLDIRILLSECEGIPKDNSKLIIKNDINISNFERSYAITDLLNKHHDKPIKNIKIRNWFRSSKHAFHDRFIITSKGVWHLGSSIKDLGNYHSTIYRMEYELGKQIELEFDEAWDGNFAGMNPSGFSISPDIQWISNKKGE